MASGPFLATGAAAALPQGYRVPPEEAAHELTFMQWPVTREVYSDRFFRRMSQRTIAEIANAIVEFEPVIMLAHPDDHDAARRLLSDRVTLWDIPTDDLWCRDAGPLCAVHPTQGRAISNLNFNGWGNRQGHARDGRIAAEVANRLDFPIYDSGLQGEAGGVDQDGHGLLIAHASSWINPNRNAGSRAEITEALKRAFGADRLIWAPGVVGQDITDYHIDSLARLTGPGRVLIQLPDDPDPYDDFHQAALETHDILAAEGLDITVISEPTRPRNRRADFVAAYANYYVCNGAVLAAEFGDNDADDAAHDPLAYAYPGREIVMLNVDPLGELGGGIHCATQQLPANSA